MVTYHGAYLLHLSDDYKYAITERLHNEICLSSVDLHRGCLNEMSIMTCIILGYSNSNIVVMCAWVDDSDHVKIQIGEFYAGRRFESYGKKGYECSFKRNLIGRCKDRQKETEIFTHILLQAVSTPLKSVHCHM